MTLPSAEDSKKTNKLKEENERLKSERLCSVCLTKDKNVLFLPCAHLAACLDCSFNMQSCPLCRTKIKATVRTYSWFLDLNKANPDDHFYLLIFFFFDFVKNVLAFLNNNKLILWLKFTGMWIDFYFEFCINFVMFLY